MENTRRPPTISLTIAISRLNLTIATSLDRGMRFSRHDRRGHTHCRLRDGAVICCHVALVEFAGASCLVWPRLKNNPTRVNERETTKRRRRFSLPATSLRVAKLACPRRSPPGAEGSTPERGGEHSLSLPPGSHAASRFLSSSLLLHRLLGGVLSAADSSLGETRPSPGVERACTHPAPLSEIVRRPRCGAATGVEIYSPCPTLLSWPRARPRVISKQLVAKSIHGVPRAPLRLFFLTFAGSAR